MRLVLDLETSSTADLRLTGAQAYAEHPDTRVTVLCYAVDDEAVVTVTSLSTVPHHFVAAVRAYDRVLLSGFYIVPLFHAQDQWIAASSKLARPRNLPRYGPASGGATLDTWWRKEP